jgi:hypothetical protein
MDGELIIEPSDPSWGLDTTLAKTASDVVRHFFTSMKHGMSHVKTEKKALGWVHPMSQGRDGIIRIFPCGQFVVLGKSKDVDYYQMVGEAYILSIETEYMAT